MKTSAISPTPNPSVMLTPNPIAIQPAGLMSESPRLVQKATITTPIASTSTTETTSLTFEIAP
jgi:hypothetical protein